MNKSMNAQLVIFGREWVIGVAVIVSIYLGCGISTDSTAALYEKDHSITFSAGAPPGAICVEDSAGRSSGIDFSKPIKPDGGAAEINQIPNTYIMTHASDDDSPDGDNEVGGLEDMTGWQIIVFDGGTQTYKVNVLGIKYGLCEIYVGPSRIDTEPGASGGLWNYLFVFEGIQRVLIVDHTPHQVDQQVQVSREVTPSMLFSIVNKLCEVNMLGPSGICNSLLKKLEAAKESLARGNRKAAKGQLMAFMAELDAQSGKHIKIYVAKTLKEDANALLGSIQQRKRWWWPLDWF